MTNAPVLSVRALSLSAHPMDSSEMLAAAEPPPLHGPRTPALPRCCRRTHHTRRAPRDPLVPRSAVAASSPEPAMAPPPQPQPRHTQSFAWPPGPPWTGGAVPTVLVDKRSMDPPLTRRHGAGQPATPAPLLAILQKSPYVFQK
jgi:hypothetical protein